jgi:hypothetical protein
VNERNIADWDGVSPHPEFEALMTAIEMALGVPVSRDLDATPVRDDHKRHASHPLVAEHRPPVDTVSLPSRDRHGLQRVDNHKTPVPDESEARPSTSPSVAWPALVSRNKALLALGVAAILVTIVALNRNSSPPASTGDGGQRSAVEVASPNRRMPC